MPTLTGLAPALQRPRQLQTEDLGAPSGAAAASGMDVDELEDDDEDAAAQRMPPPSKRARGSQGAPASRGALPLLGLGLSLWLVPVIAKRQAGSCGWQQSAACWGASARRQAGGFHAALAGSVASFRG